MARRFVRQALQRTRVDDDVVATAELLVSEVVTNALVHAGSPVEMVVRSSDERVRVEVGDTSSRAPRAQPVDVEAASGRGLAIVESLATGWGIRPVPDDGKWVWFEIER